MTLSTPFDLEVVSYLTQYAPLAAWWRPVNYLSFYIDVLVYHINLLFPGSGGSMSDLLHAELKRWMNVIIQNKELNCLESVQAMLVVACYSAERSLILSFATRMALDLELHEAFEELIQRLALRNEDMAYALPHQMFEEERALIWNARTWFGLLVLEHM
jgi:hypothetical protein